MQARDASDGVPEWYKDSATSTQKLTNSRGIELHLRLWTPSEAKVRAVMVLVHGFSWHSLYFGGLASQVAEHGIACVAYDLQGHGLSGSVDGLRGYHAKFSDTGADLKQVLALARSMHPGVPVFLLGESMGGTIVLRLLQTDPEVVSQLAGVALLGPVVRVASAVLPPPPVMFILRLLARFFPRMEVPDDSIEKGFEGAFGDAEFAQRAKRDDALIVFNRPRIGFAVDLLDNCKKLAAGLQDIKVPFIALHGTLDDRTEPKNTQELADRSLGEDKTVVMVEGGKHQLLQDRAEITADVIQRVLEWVGPALLNMHVKDCDRVREL